VCPVPRHITSPQAGASPAKWLQVTTLVLPESLERLRAAKKKEEFVNVLALAPEPVSGPTSLEARACSPRSAFSRTRWRTKSGALLCTCGAFEASVQGSVRHTGPRQPQRAGLAAFRLRCADAQSCGVPAYSPACSDRLPLVNIAMLRQWSRCGD
jgi:hypothetical protein